MTDVTQPKRDDVDRASADSFPASDAPSWNKTTVDKKSDDNTDTADAKSKSKMNDKDSKDKGSCGC